MKEWERFFSGKSPEKQKPKQYVRNLVPLFRRRKVKRIFDLGCGAGRHMMYFAKKGFFVVGQDISTMGLALAQQWFEQEKISNYLLVNHDVTELPYPDGSFDAVISTSAIHHNKLKQINKALSEVYRVMKKGGLLFVNLTAREAYLSGREIEKGTYVVRSGPEKGMVHHMFNEMEIRKTFSKFRILKLVKPTKEERHWLLLAEKTVYP